MAEIEVSCRPADGGWTCSVKLTEGGSTTRHDVTVSREDLGRLAPGAATPDELVRRSFEFLLAREPKESILRSFGLAVIGRYFPDYERSIRR